VYGGGVFEDHVNVFEKYLLATVPPSHNISAKKKRCYCNKNPISLLGAYGLTI
jgi:hypothetical protein